MHKSISTDFGIWKNSLGIRYLKLIFGLLSPIVISHVRINTISLTESALTKDLGNAPKVYENISRCFARIYDLSNYY